MWESDFGTINGTASGCLDNSKVVRESRVEDKCVDCILGRGFVSGVHLPSKESSNLNGVHDALH